jgi:hypothetical protein
VGKRGRKRAGSGGGEDVPRSTTAYPFGEDGSLTLRDELSAGTLRTLRKLDAQPAASAEDRWQRRVELLFERLVVSWEIAGLPLDNQRELLGRYRMASAEERRLVREALTEHLRARYPEIEV